MRAEVISRFGDAGVFHEEDAPIPEPRSDEVLVRVRATSVNPVDAKIRRGGGFGISPPAILGYDVSGTVEAAGDSVTGFGPGDEVFYSPPIDTRGSYAEFHAVPARVITHKPPSLTHEEAAALPLAGCTAIQGLLDRARLQTGDRVLVHGDGGVGSLAVQIARAAGCHVVVVGSDYMQEKLLTLGADRAIDYHREDFIDVVSSELGEGSIDIIFDTVGGDTLERSLPLAADCCRLVTILEDCRGAFGPAIAKNVRLELLLMYRSGVTMARLARLVERGLLRPIVDSVMPLARVAEAHERLEAGGVRGKIVLSTAVH